MSSKSLPTILLQLILTENYEFSVFHDDGASLRENSKAW